MVGNHQIDEFIRFILKVKFVCSVFVEFKVCFQVKDNGHELNKI